MGTVARQILAMFLLASALIVNLPTPTLAAEQLGRFLKRVQSAEIFPGAERLGRPQGDPPAAPAYAGDTLLGYVFLNSDVVNAVGYSGKPIHVLLSLDLEGVIRGAKLVEHYEPIVLVGIPEKRITKVIEDYIGFDIAALARSGSRESAVDIVSGATVTVMVIDDSILRSSLRVARRHGLGGLEVEPAEERRPLATIDTSQRGTEDWGTLRGDGSLGRLHLTIGDINQAFAESGDPVAAQRRESGDPKETYIDLYAALVSVPTIGLSLLGKAEYANLEKQLQPEQHAILLAGRGRYSFKGSGYVRGGIFDRFQVIQGDNSLRFRDRDHKRLRRIAAVGAPDMVEVDLFRIPEDSVFDPAEPWRLELLVSRPTGPTSKAFLTFDLGYATPERYLKKVAPPAVERPEAEAAPSEVRLGQPPLWQRLWQQKIGQVVILVAAISALTVIFFIQSWLVKRPRLTDAVRIGFLAFTLFGIGFYANAQLSVVNIMAFFNALIIDFRWDYFLMDPLIFILWASVAASLMFWGRGPFCGWLCPFGALQELLSRVAKQLGVPQFPVPWWLHERLWPIKYMIFLALFGISLYSLALAERLAEIEPFKTAIVLKFARDWPFVLFAVGLLAAGLFIERFYCRYLCPVGAALAIPGRMRMFEWLKRYKECGAPCKRCASECMVQAIHPEGHINPNECLYCLHCQVLYHDDHKCPVMIQRRLKSERRTALASTNLPPNRKSKAANPETLADFLPG
jgi:NosR/NirI family nitrous oxide reductase transcriptional regulator